MENTQSYTKPVKISNGVYWIGSREKGNIIDCNPYIIIQNDKAILIDPGSRSDFSFVMMQILQLGISPSQIVAIIYSHYDPDLCGSVQNFIDICDNPELLILTSKQDLVFVSYYIHKDYYKLLKAIDDYSFVFDFGPRKLHFIPVRYAHSLGSFVTYDESSKIMFSGDLFGSFSGDWPLFFSVDESCWDIEKCKKCIKSEICQIVDIINFHNEVMPCCKSLRNAINQIKDYDLKYLAPQHGSIISKNEEIKYLMNLLSQLEEVGIDGIL